VLLKIFEPSAFGDWSYEVEDTKLAKETSGGTILQLAMYTDLLASVQEKLPQRFHVVTPDLDDPVRSYRVWPAPRPPNSLEVRAQPSKRGATITTIVGRIRALAL
jgi:predicted RecB family nuclease